MSKAYSLIELVFVLIILGVLAGIALPHFASSRQDAKLLKLRAELEMIRAGIALARNNNLLKGIDAYPSVLDESVAGGINSKLFSCSKAQISACASLPCCTNAVLERPISSSAKAWMKKSSLVYSFFISQKDELDFKYTSKDGSFECISSKCKAFEL